MAVDVNLSRTLTGVSGCFYTQRVAVLGTKLHLPAARPNLVPRQRLTDRMSGGLPRVVLVSAPAGFGKTTLLTQWLHRSGAADQRVAWVSLDEADNDPARLLEHVVAALASARDLPETSLLMADATTPPAVAVLTNAVNELDAHTGVTVLALDDYHVIDTAEAHAVATFLLEHAPPQLTLAIATRSDPPLPLPRLRARGELLELRAVDLRFTDEETASFLDRVMGLALPPEDVKALTTRTEGWVAGLQLAGLSLQGVEDSSRFVQEFTGTNRFILDYLVDEVLAHQPEDIRQFLLDTSILHELTGPLADALTGRRDGRAVLESLDRANLFVVALDAQRTWYRYHHLFVEALRARLLADHPDRVPHLHHAASSWYADHGRPQDAVRHALDADDPGRAADLVEWALPDLRRTRHDQRISDWLTALPDDITRERALLATYRAWTRLAAGDLEGVDSWLAAAEDAYAAHPPVVPAHASKATGEELRTLPATMAIFRASAAQARGDTTASQQHARHALDLIGPDDHMARGGAAGFLGMAAWAEGNLEDAVATFSTALRSLAAAGDVADELGGTVPLGSMWVARGRPDEARRLFERALEGAAKHPGAALATLGDLHVGLADVLVEQGHLELASEHLTAASTLGETASLLENRYRLPMTTARLRRALGDPDVALRLLQEAADQYMPGFFPDVRPLAAQQARIHIAQGRLAEARDWAATQEVDRHAGGGYLDEFNQLTYVRLLLASHRADPDAEILGDAHARLDLIAEEAHAGGRGATIVEAHLLRSLLREAHGNRHAALAELTMALELGVPAGFVRLFLDEGAPLEQLLSVAERHPRAAVHARTLRHATYRPDAAITAGPAETLSERELDVLRLLATTLSGPEIAKELFVSVNTLRTHTKHIFAKLDVKTRRAAVERAHALGHL
jgi:LuxR family maltose regulon positive regulatory protein